MTLGIFVLCAIGACLFLWFLNRATKQKEEDEEDGEGYDFYEDLQAEKNTREFKHLVAEINQKGEIVKEEPDPAPIVLVKPVVTAVEAPPVAEIPKEEVSAEKVKKPRKPRKPSKKTKIIK